MLNCNRPEKVAIAGNALSSFAITPKERIPLSEKKPNAAPAHTIGTISWGANSHRSILPLLAGSELMVNALAIAGIREKPAIAKRTESQIVSIIN